MLLPGYHLTGRRLSVDETNGYAKNRRDSTFMPSLPQSQEESNRRTSLSTPSPAPSPTKSPAKSPKKRKSKNNRRKSRDFNISVLPAFMGGKKRIPAKMNELAEEKRLHSPPQVQTKRETLIELEFWPFWHTAVMQQPFWYGGQFYKKMKGKTKFPTVSVHFLFPPILTFMESHF